MRFEEAYGGWQSGRLGIKRAQASSQRHNCVAFEGMKLQISADRHRMHYVKVKVGVHR